MKKLITMCLSLLVAMMAGAQVTDYTSLVGTSSSSWHGNDGDSGNDVKVTTDAGNLVSMARSYYDNRATGRWMYQEVNVKPGIYVVNLYAVAKNERHTPNPTDGSEDAVYVYAKTSATNYVECPVVVYDVKATGDGKTTGYGDDRVKTPTIYTIVVTVSSGETLEIGLGQNSAAADWCHLQIKGLVKIGNTKADIVGVNLLDPAAKGNTASGWAYDSKTRGNNWGILGSPNGEYNSQCWESYYYDVSDVKNGRLMYRNIAGLPHGSYTLKGAIIRNADEGDIELYLGKDKTTITPSDEGKGQTKYFTVSGSTQGAKFNKNVPVGYGLRNVSAKGQWYAIGDVTLTYDDVISYPSYTGTWNADHSQYTITPKADIAGDAITYKINGGAEQTWDGTDIILSYNESDAVNGVCAYTIVFTERGFTTIARARFTKPNAWVAPLFPGADMPGEADGTTPYYMCNVETGAFYMAGMNWESKAIAQRLTNGDTEISTPHRCVVTTTDGNKLQIWLGTTVRGDGKCLGGNEAHNLYSDSDRESYRAWTATETFRGSHEYTLANGYEGDLDIYWKNGGPLTTTDGKGKTKWGFVKEEDITHGNYALYVAKVKLYNLYQACVASGCNELYAEAISTALTAYNNPAATAATIKDAYVALFKATYMAVDNSSTLDASLLFTDADMCGAGSANNWGGADGNINKGWSVFERYHGANFTRVQTQENLPSGYYSATLHAFYRQDDSATENAPTISVIAEKTKSMEVKAMSEVEFGTVDGNSKERRSGFTAGPNSKPDDMRSAGVAICHEDLEYTTEYAPNISGGNVTVKMEMTGGHQWLLWQDIKFTYKGMTLADLTAMMASKIAAARALLDKPMSAVAKTALNDAISQAEGGTRAQILQSGPVLDAAIAAANTSIAEFETAVTGIIPALERFQADYNANENGAKRGMSDEAWTTVLNAVKAAAMARDFKTAEGSAIETVDAINATATALNTALDNAEASIAKYAKYANLLTTATTFNATQNNTALATAITTYGADSNKATDATVVAAFDAIYATYIAVPDVRERDVTALLGENTDFEVPQSYFNLTAATDRGVYKQPGWTITYGTNVNFALETKEDIKEGSAGTHSLKVYANWGADVMQATKAVTLPEGNYRLSMSMKMPQKNWNTNLNYVQIGDTRTPLSVGSEWETVNVNIDLEEETEITISLGHSAADGGNHMREVYVDDITLTLFNQTAYERAYAAVDALKGGTSVAIASVIKEFPATQAEAEAANINIETAIAVMNNAVTMAAANDKATGLLTNADFRGSVVGSGRAAYPAGWNFTIQKDGDSEYNLPSEGVFNMWAANLKEAILSQQMNNLPDGIYELTAMFKNDAHDGKSGIGIFADGTGTATGRSIDVGTGDKNNSDFYPATAYVQVKGHKMNVGVFSNKGYYQVKDIQVTMVADNAANRAKVGNCRIYQTLWYNRSADEYDFTAEAFAEAQGADIKPMLYTAQHPNALFKAKAGQLNFTDNVIINGTCANLVLTDKAPFKTSADFTATSASYERTMGTKWGTVMLPYAVSSDENVQFYTLKKVVEGEDGYMSFVEAETLAANTPGVFVKKNESAESITLAGSNVAVPASTGVAPVVGTDDAAGWTLNGTFEGHVFEDVKSDDANEYYYISGDKFWHATGKLTMYPFRAYFTTPKNAAGVRTFRLVIDDDATAINTVPQSNGKQTVYTLSGVRLNNTDTLKPGIYIINNKKTIVK